MGTLMTHPQSSSVQMTQAGELSNALQDSLSILKENKDAKEFRQTMHLDSKDENGEQEIEKVNTAMSQVIRVTRHPCKRPCLVHHLETGE